MIHLRIALPLTLASLILAAPRVASACQPRTVCIRWDTEIIDNGFGEGIVLEKTIPARGARVTLLRPPPETPFSTFLDEEGCMTFETQFAYGHKLIVHGEAWVGWYDLNGPIHILTQRQMIKGDTTSGFVWPIDLQGLAPDDVVEVSIHTEKDDPIAPLLALSTEVMYRLDKLGVLPPPNAELRIQFLDWYGNARGGCGLIQVGPDSFREKFVVAHEIGHWLQCEWNGAFGMTDPKTQYGYAPTDDPCEFDVVVPMWMDKMIGTDGGDHGLRSAEWSTPAMREGFAHFVAALAFNWFEDFNNDEDEDGIFRYYKDIDPSYTSYTSFVDPQGDNYRVSLFGGAPNQTPLGGENRWTEGECPQDWEVEHVSSELDWMRFFWFFLTRSGDAPTLSQILGFFAYVAQNDTVDLVNAWPELRAKLDVAPGMSSFADRFEDANCAMGVYNADTCQ